MSSPPALLKLVRTGADNRSSPITQVRERGGPWDSVALNPAFHPALQTALPLTIVYRRDAALGWLPHLLVAESTLLSRVGGPRGLGVYALKRFRGEASSTLSITNITTLFNITGSTLLRQSAFEGLFGLPDRISWVDARAVYTALLDALAAVRATPDGAAIESLLMASGTAPNTSPSAVIAAFVEAVEAHATHRLNTAPRMGVESGGGSASSCSNQTTPSAPSPVPLPTLPLPPASTLRNRLLRT